MNYQNFLYHVTTTIQQQLGENTRLSVQKIEKNNGVHYDGLVIMRPGCNISPAIFLDAYYHRYLEGVTLEDICGDILDAYHAKLPTSYFDTQFFLDYEKVRPRIVPKLINYDRNRDLLKKLPHTRYLDLAVVFQCLVNTSQNEQASILIHNQHMARWDVNTEDLLEAALHNGPLLQPCQFSSMSQLLGMELCPSADDSPSADEIPSVDVIPSANDIASADDIPSANDIASADDIPSDGILPMYVLTNQVRINGASTILYHGLLPCLCSHFGTDLIVLPSSIHEVLVIPFQGWAEKSWQNTQKKRSLQDLSCQESPNIDHLDYFTQMVREVNETQVLDDEVLSDNAYFYSREKKELQLIPSARESYNAS